MDSSRMSRSTSLVSIETNVLVVLRSRHQRAAQNAYTKRSVATQSGPLLCNDSWSILRTLVWPEPLPPESFHSIEVSFNRRRSHAGVWRQILTRIHFQTYPHLPSVCPAAVAKVSQFQIQIWFYISNFYQTESPSNSSPLHRRNRPSGTDTL